MKSRSICLDCDPFVPVKHLAFLSFCRTHGLTVRPARFKGRKAYRIIKGVHLDDDELLWGLAEHLHKAHAVVIRSVTFTTKAKTRIQTAQAVELRRDAIKRTVLGDFGSPERDPVLTLEKMLTRDDAERFLKSPASVDLASFKSIRNGSVLDFVHSLLTSALYLRLFLVPIPDFRFSFAPPSSSRRRTFARLAD